MDFIHYIQIGLVGVGNVAYICGKKKPIRKDGFTMEYNFLPC